MQILEFKKYLVCLAIALFFIQSLAADIVGSDTAVSVENNYDFPTSTTNTISSFAWMKNGFSFADPATSCTFESVFPVGGVVNFRGGTVYLNTDLCFNEMSTLKNTGTIVSAQSQTVDLAPTMTYLGNSVYSTILDNISLNMHYDLTLEGTLVINRDVIINGNYHVFDLGSGEIIVNDNSSITFNNVFIVGVDTANVSCKTMTGQIIMKDVTWYQDANTFTFTQGSIAFKNNVSLVGSATFNYASGSTSTIYRNSVLRVADGMKMVLGRAHEGALEPLYFEDPNSALFFDNGELKISQYGAQLTRGSMLIAGKLGVDVVGTTSLTGLKMGEATIEDDLRIELLPGSHVSFLSGYVLLYFADQDNFTAQAPTTQITRKAANTFHLLSDITLKNVTIEAETGSILLFDTDKKLYYDNVTVLLGKTTFDVTGYRYNSYTNALNGNSELFLSKGALPAYTRVSGQNNYLRGLGAITGLVYLTGTDAQLSLDFDGVLNQSIHLNGGTVTLARNLNSAYNALMVGPGIIDLGNNTWYLGTSENVWSDDIFIQSTGGTIHCNATVTFDAAITCSGLLTIEGRYNHISFGSQGSLVVQPNSTVVLRNVYLDAVTNAKLLTVDDTATIIFENSRLEVDGLLTYSTGTIEIKELVEFNGTGTFVYQSNQSLLVHQDGTLLCEDITLELKKASATADEPIVFEDKTGTLHLKNSNLSLGAYGMNFLKGKLLCEDDVRFYLNSVNMADALVVGDLTESNDSIWYFLPGATVTYYAGSYVMNFYALNGIVARSNITKIMRKTNSLFYFNSDLELPHLTIESEDAAHNFVASGKILSFDDCIILGNGYAFDLTGHRFNQFTNTLKGNNEISLTKGILPAFTRVEGTGNSIRGTGDIGGKVTLIDQDAELTLALNGSIYKDIALNNGTLIVARDVNMAYNAMITGSGTVQLEKATVTFGLQESSITGTLLIQSTESSLSLRNKMALSGKLVTSGNLTIDGNSNIFEFMSTGSFVVGSGSTVRFKNIILKDVQGTNLYATDTSSTIILENSACILSGGYSYTTGALIIEDEVVFSGAYTCTLASPIPAQVKAYASWSLQDDIIFTTGRYGSTGGTEPIEFENETAQLITKNAILKILPTGITLTKGQWIINESVAVDIQSTSTVDGMIMGDGTAVNDMTITFLSGSRVNFTTGHCTYNFSNPYQIQAFSKNSNLRMDDNVQFHIQKDCVLKTLYLENEPFAVVTTETNASLVYNNCLIDMQGEQFNISGKNHPQGILLGGNGSIILDRGTLRVPVLIENIDNKIIGSGNIAQSIALQDVSATVSVDVLGEVRSDINLQNSQLYLQRDLVFAAQGQLQGEGVVNLANNSCFLSYQDQTITHTISWLGDGNSRIVLTGNYIFEGKWLLQGNIIVEGIGDTHCIFNNLGSFDIAPNSTIIFKGIIFERVSSFHCGFTETSASVIFDNCSVLLDDALTMTVHNVTLKQRNSFAGSHGITFSAEAGVIVQDKSSLEILDGGTCSVFTTTTLVNPLTFETESSQLVLYDSTLKLVDQDLSLTKGTLFVKGSSKIEGTLGNEVLYVGDETVDSDQRCIMKAGASLRLSQCTFAYKNLDQNIFTQDSSSRLICSSNATLALYQSLYGQGGVILDEGATLHRAELAHLTIPVTVGGAINYGAL